MMWKAFLYNCLIFAVLRFFIRLRLRFHAEQQTSLGSFTISTIIIQDNSPRKVTKTVLFSTTTVQYETW